jgi:hypothetical protein
MMITCCPEIFLPWLRRSGTLVGLTAVHFVQRARLIIVACTLLAAPFFGSAAPTPGCADLTHPGIWYERLSDYGDLEYDLDLSDGVTCRIQGSYVYLTNTLGTFWYSPADTNISFEIYLTSLAVQSRRPGDPSTNGGYTEVEVAAHGGRFIYLATYAGTPSVIYVAPDPGTGTAGYTMTTAPLSWARLCIGSAVASPGIPVTIRRAPTGSSQIELSWGSFTNRLYQLQCCSDLSKHQWTNLGSPIASTGASHRAIDAVESQRFYRILEFP